MFPTRRFQSQLRFVAMVAFLAAQASGHAIAHAQAVRVDAELVLAADISLSMLPHELAIQRGGYAAALTDPRVIEAMLGGPNRRIALTYVEWAGVDDQRVVIPWSIIDSAATIANFANHIDKAPAPRTHRTSVSGALDFAAAMFDGNGIDSPIRIIDISGDGVNNQGGPVVVARDNAVASGITINGLVLMTDDGLLSSFEIADLDVYYSQCVIGGPGAFSIAVDTWEQFADAVRRKLVREVAGIGAPAKGGPAELHRAAFPIPPYDCLIGEKLWNRK
jgi:hypothetical protein